MWASEMVGGCGIGSWTRNSRLVLASADNVSAPFSFEKEIAGVFSHEPIAVRAPTGEFVVFFTTTAYGCGLVGSCVPLQHCDLSNATSCPPGGVTCWQNCTGGVTAPGCYDVDQDHPPWQPSIRFPTYMTYASAPRGPYSPPVMVYNGSDRQMGAGGGGATGDTNLAPVIMADGSLVGLWRGSRYPDHSQFQFVVTARDWRDPASYVWGEAIEANNIFPSLASDTPKHGRHNCGIEDPSLWLGADGVLHALFHN